MTLLDRLEYPRQEQALNLILPQMADSLARRLLAHDFSEYPPDVQDSPGQQQHPDGTERSVPVHLLPFLTGFWAGLLPDLDALLITSDLQGVVMDPQWQSTLLGVAVVNEYLSMAAAKGWPDPQWIGVILAGDFYSAPQADKCGAINVDKRVVPPN